MKKIKLDMPVVIAQLKDHFKIKNEILDLINREQGAERIYEEKSSTLDISRCDYKISYEPRQWTTALHPYLTPTVQEIYASLGYQTYNIHNIWFQQYDSGSTHGWHVHTKCQWTNVYYIDMPDDAPKTELINPWNQTDIIQMDVKEGDVLSFPSFVIHRAPINKCNKTKTIISFNSDTEIDASIY